MGSSSPSCARHNELVAEREPPLFGHMTTHTLRPHLLNLGRGRCPAAAGEASARSHRPDPTMRVCQHVLDKQAWRVRA
jgi:hypothetical protein